jgi:hypothetical protein
MKRIVYMQAVGKPRFAEMALGLARSLSLIGDDTPRVIVTDQKGFPWGRYFDKVLEPVHPVEWIFFSRLDALERTDADQIITIDGDCLAFKRLAPIFDYCRGKGFVVQGHHTSEGYWYADIAETCRKFNVPSLGRFNGGLMYYERSPETKKFLEKVFEYGKQFDELGFKRKTKLIPDEPVIGLAMATERFGHVASEEMDFHNSAVGLIGKLRMDVMKNECRFVCRRHAVRYVEPYVFHAHFYSKFFIYWKQLKKLEQLEKYEDRHGFGYMSTAHKLRRSIERRWLKLKGKL